MQRAPDEEKPTLFKWLLEQEKNPMLRFGTEGRSLDPFAQTEDLGDDAMKSTAYGVLNLERIMGNLIHATEKQDENFNLLQEMYYNLIGQWRMGMTHVANYVGGVEAIEKVFGEEGRVYTMIPADKQREAIKYIGDNAFKTPLFLQNLDVIRKFEPTGSVELIERCQARLLQTMMDDDKLKRIAENELLEPDNCYKLSDAFNDIYMTVWSDLNSPSIKIDPYRQALQQEYVRILEAKLKNQNDLRAMSRYQLTELKSKINTSIAKSGDIYTKAHLQDLSAEIERILNPKN